MGKTEKITLTETEESLVFYTAGKRVIARILHQPLGRVMTALGEEIGSKPVLGAFVSLKRHGELRSCMGCLANSMTLANAIETAADRAATDDPRFPPISPIELENLEMEVWLLWGMEEVEKTGQERLDAFEIGKHGLQIQLGPQRGLLLPGVAIEHKMDALGFLEAVCQKAGLPKDAWQDPRTKLSIFEGKVISAPFSLVLSGEKSIRQFTPRHNGPSVKDVFGLCESARRNFFKYLDGATPHYYFPEFYDGNVNGLAFSITLPDTAPLVCAQHELKPVIPLQASLVKFSHALGEQIKRIGASSEDLLASRFTLTIHWDMAIHGQIDDYDLNTVDTSHRSLMLSSQDGWAILFDSSSDADELLDEARDLLGVDDSLEGTIYSFETVSTMSRFELTSFPRDPIYPSLRPAALAGSFYPAQAKEMESELRRMFQDTDQKQPEDYAAVLVPHAGWIYSGQLAAQTLSQVKIPETVMIFSPKHRPGGSPWAVAPFQLWGLPFGNVEGDLKLAEEFAHSVKEFMLDPIPHKQEHAIEVQLPLLKRLKSDIRVVGVTMSGGEWDEIHDAADQFAQQLKQLETPPLLIISSDMNHYASEELTNRLDEMVISAIQTRNPEKLLDIVSENRISMCGVHAAVFVLETLRIWEKLNEVTVVGHTTSGAVSGDFQRVVGYAGMLFR